MLIGLGHDIQRISEMEGAQAIRQPGLFFTADESCRSNTRKDLLNSLASIFCAKEAMFKALPEVAGFFWTDIEVIHDDRGAPGFRLHGELSECFRQRGWSARLSISHSGDYVSAVVVIEGK